MTHYGATFRRSGLGRRLPRFAGFVERREAEITAVLAVVCVLGTITGVIALAIAIGAQGDIEDAQQATFDSRRKASQVACEDREALKDDMRTIIASFGIDPRSLPRRRDGSVRLARLPITCRAYAERAVPEASRPAS